MKNGDAPAFQFMSESPLGLNQEFCGFTKRELGAFIVLSVMFAGGAQVIEVAMAIKYSDELLKQLEEK